LAEDYQNAVAPEIKAKMMTHFAESTHELGELFLAGKLS
jgi:hypothetical protein